MKGFAFQRSKLVSLSAAMLAVGASTGFISTAIASADSGTLNGAGSTLVAPLEAEWASAFNSKTGNTVNYNPVGSGTGIADISAGTVDFGASDAPLSPSQASGCANCIQIPWALSAHRRRLQRPRCRAQAPPHGAPAGPDLPGPISNWNDPQIKKVNKDAHLPNLKITPVFRSDGSGDTYVFTDFLSQISSAWKSQVGVGTVGQLPRRRVGGKGNSGVTAVLQGTPGSVAYIAASYLIAHQLPAVAVQNRAGNFEYPNLSNIENAAAVVKHVPASMALSIVNPPKSAKIAYPISTFTYVIAPTTLPAGAAEVVRPVRIGCRSLVRRQPGLRAAPQGRGQGGQGSRRPASSPAERLPTSARSGWRVPPGRAGWSTATSYVPAQAGILSACQAVLRLFLQRRQLCLERLDRHDRIVSGLQPRERGLQRLQLLLGCGLGPAEVSRHLALGMQRRQRGHLRLERGDTAATNPAPSEGSWGVGMRLRRRVVTVQARDGSRTQLARRQRWRAPAAPADRQRPAPPIGAHARRSVT